MPAGSPLARRLVTLLGCAVVALPATAALGADGGKERVQLTASGQVAARAAVLTPADLGSTTGWTGGPKKPDLSSKSPCPGFHPRQSDLVVNGAAETVYQHTGLRLDSQAEVLRTARMVQLDWQRSVLSPQFLPCLRVGVAKAAGSNARVVSLERISFPHVATYTAAVRVVLEVASSGVNAQVVIDTILFGSGRTEIILAVAAPAAAVSVIVPAEVRLARVLAGRIRA